MQAINTDVYIQQPGYRSFVNSKCVDPPNLRPTPRITNLSLHTFQGMNTEKLIVFVWSMEHRLKAMWSEFKLIVIAVSFVNNNANTICPLMSAEVLFVFYEEGEEEAHLQVISQTSNS